jgi:hypothetical protein
MIAVFREVDDSESNIDCTRTGCPCIGTLGISEIPERNKKAVERRLVARSCREFSCIR